MKEQTIRLGTMNRILQRAEIIEEDEQLVDIEFDVQVNLFTLYTEKVSPQVGQKGDEL